MAGMVDINPNNGGIPPEEKLVLTTTNLNNSRCGLNHDKNNDQPRKPVDYIVQQFEDFTVHTPICQECLDKFESKKWILLFCTNCMESIWIHKEVLKRPYLYDADQYIRWMSICPYCANSDPIKLAEAVKAAEDARAGKLPKLGKED